MAQILLTPFSSLFLHGVLAVVLSGALGASIYLTRTRLQPLAAYIFGAALVVLHVVLAGAFALSTSAEPPPVLAALERLAALSGLAWFAWLGVRTLRPQLADVGLIAIMALVLLAFGLAGFLPEMPREPFNRTLPDAVWTAAGLLLCVGAIVAASRASPRRWLSALGFAFVTIGFAMHLGLGPVGESLPAFVRLGQILGYPVLAAGVVFTSAAAQPPPATQASPPPAREEIRTAGALEMAGLLVAEDAEDLARRSVRALARALGADLCLLLTPPDEAGNYTIAMGYDLVREQVVSGAALDSRRTPVLAEALRRRRAAALPARSRVADIPALQTALNVKSVGAGLFAPLEHGGELLGGFLLLSPYSALDWGDSQRRGLLAVAPLVAQRIHELRHTRMGAAPVSPISVTGAGASGDGPATEAPPAEETAVAPATSGETAAPRTRLASAVAAGDQSTVSGQFHKLAIDLQLALQELAEARARADAVDAAPAPAASSALPAPRMETIAAATRDLRQPIVFVAGYTDLLLGESMGLLGAMQRKFLQRARDGARRAQELLQRLVDLTDAEGDRLSRATGPVDLRRGFDEAMERMAGSIRTRGQSVLGELPPDLPMIRGEENALLQILVHLLANASAATPAGGQILVRSSIHPAERPAFLQLSIQDGGEGKAAAELLRAFHAPLRESVRFPAVAEEGADLAMVRALTEAIGGRVWAESGAGGGTAISILLPIAEPRPDSASEPAGEGGPEQTQPPKRSPE